MKLKPEKIIKKYMNMKFKLKTKRPKKIRKPLQNKIKMVNISL